jgi:hypothetical protein
MTVGAPASNPVVDRLRDLFALDLTKVILSIIILASVLPVPWVQSFAVVFFGIFSVELALRGYVIVHDLRSHKLNRIELVVFAFDLAATLSFLPVEAFWDDARLLRLFRLSRMLLLISYWGPIVREVGLVISKRERRYQLSFVMVSVVILAFTSAIILDHFRVQGIDFNGDGNPANDTSFWSMLWWAFLQIESPDNLLKDPDLSLAFFFSIFLTVFGLFLFSFLIGIGASIVEELVQLSKERRIGMRQHSVICNLSLHNRVLLEELVTYYAKSFRAPKLITLGPVERRYDYMHEGALRKIRYREGSALTSHDLIKVDTDRARRVILLGQRDHESSDSEVISQILSVREVNPRCDIYAELFHADNLDAARRAGRSDEGRTVPLLANRLVSLYLANLIVFPGVEKVFAELLSSTGEEIYTCVYEKGLLSGLRPPSGAILPYAELLARGHRAHGVLLLGHLLDDPASPTGITHAFLPGAAPWHHPAVPEVSRLRGFFGVATNFSALRDFVASLPDVGPAVADAPPEELPRFAVCPGATHLRELLICGFHAGTVAFCEELILFTRVPRLHLVVPEGHDREAVARAFCELPLDPTGVREDGAHVRFSAEPNGVVRYAVDGAEGVLRIHWGDWSDEKVLLGEEGCHRLADLDAVLLSYLPGEPDPDARSALALLKLIRIKESRPELLKAGFRIFCEVQNDEKAALFQRRFGDAGGAHGCSTITIVAAETMRNAFLAQGVFVPGIFTIYRELLGQAGVYLSKLIPQGPATDAALEFGPLVSELYRREGLLLVAVELRDADGERQLAVSPTVKSPSYRFRRSDLLAAYVIGDPSRLIPGAPCAGCHLPT